MFPQPPRRVQRPGTSPPSRAPASRSAALCGAWVLRVPGLRALRSLCSVLSVRHLVASGRSPSHSLISPFPDFGPSIRACCLVISLLLALRRAPQSPSSSTSVPSPLLGSLLLECAFPCFPSPFASGTALYPPPSPGVFGFSLELHFYHCSGKNKNPWESSRGTPQSLLLTLFLLQQSFILKVLDFLQHLTQ